MNYQQDHQQDHQQGYQQNYQSDQQPHYSPEKPPNQPTYIGLPKRFLAAVIDGFITNLLIALFFFGQAQQTPTKAIVAFLLTLVIQWAYYAFLESSPEQATLGKMALGIMVTDHQGKKPSLRRASLRYLGKWFWIMLALVVVIIGVMVQPAGESDSPFYGVILLLLALCFIIGCFGYLMAAFNPERQSLHDRLAKTYVVDAEARSRRFPQKAVFQVVAIALVAGVFLRMVPATPFDAAFVDANGSSIDTSTQLDDDGTEDFEDTEESSAEPSEDSTNSSGLSSDSESSANPSDNVITVNLCGIREQTFPPSPSAYLNGVWQVQFSAGQFVHNSILVMEGENGVMRTEFSEGDTPQAVLQTMRLRSSATGSWILGFDPIDATTEQPKNTYSPDNLFIQTAPSGEQTVFNCDDQGNRSPATLTFLQDEL